MRSERHRVTLHWKASRHCAAGAALKAQEDGSEKALRPRGLIAGGRYSRDGLAHGRPDAEASKEGRQWWKADRLAE